MFVLLDMEWITNYNEHQSPTQISAVRLNSGWSVVSRFDAFIKPRDNSFHDWSHIAYTGGRPIDFLCADGAYNVFQSLQNWFTEDDILLWWYDEAEELFKKLNSIILKKPEPHKSISIYKHVYAFLAGQKHSRGNPYQLAEKRGVRTVSSMHHNAKNDVRVLRELMAKIKYPQENLLRSPLASRRNQTTTKYIPDFRYAYDIKNRIIHDINCPDIIGINYRPYETIKTAVKKGAKPCECCKIEFNITLRERNQDTISRTDYNYIYAENSPVFHKRSCGTMLLAKMILGTVTYDAIIKTGKRPCKLCNPSSADYVKPLYKNKEKTKPAEEKLQITDSISRALNRQKVAKEERTRKLQETNLTESEKNDIYTLTQPRFAFWVGQGCRTFHIHSCSKINDIHNIQGFATYRDATLAGFTPCRKCKPSEKHDALLSVPFTNELRKDESSDALELLCADFGYPYKKENNFFYLETLVGKWKINTATSPVRLEHINLVKNPGENKYHKQPRLFLSFSDTFHYIKRHDDELMRKADLCYD